MEVDEEKMGKANRAAKATKHSVLGLWEIERDVMSQEHKDNTYKFVSSMA